MFLDVRLCLHLDTIPPRQILNSNPNVTASPLGACVVNYVYFGCHIGSQILRLVLTLLLGPWESRLVLDHNLVLEKR